MASLEEKLSQALTRRLRDGQVDLERLPNGRVVGHVVSSEFDGLSYDDRRKRLWQIIDEELTAEEARQVSTLLTYTPEEWNIPLQDT